jgi:DNA-binding response OmpR family regulator
MPSFHLRVLIADPAENAADSLAWMLNLWGYDVQVAYTGLEALKIAAYHHPHVALMAVALPDLDAAQLATRLRGETTIIGLAERGNDDDMRHCTESGFSYVFLKPGTAAALHLLLDGLARSLTLGRTEPPQGDR